MTLLAQVAGWLSRVPPLWWARFVYVAMLCAILLAAASAILMRQARSRIQETREALQLLNAKLDAIEARAGIPSDTFIVRRGVGR